MLQDEDNKIKIVEKTLPKIKLKESEGKKNNRKSGLISPDSSPELKTKRTGKRAAKKQKILSDSSEDDDGTKGEISSNKILAEKSASSIVDDKPKTNAAESESAENKNEKEEISDKKQTDEKEKQILNMFFGGQIRF